MYCIQYSWYFHLTQYSQLYFFPYSSNICSCNGSSTLSPLCKDNRDRFPGYLVSFCYLDLNIYGSWIFHIFRKYFNSLLRWVATRDRSNLIITLCSNARKNFVSLVKVNSCTIQLLLSHVLKSPTSILHFQVTFKRIVIVLMICPSSYTLPYLTWPIPFLLI